MCLLPEVCQFPSENCRVCVVDDDGKDIELGLCSPELSHTLFIDRALTEQ